MAAPPARRSAPDELGELRSAVERLQKELAGLDARLSLLEADRAVPLSAVPATVPPSASPSAPASATVGFGLALLGRACLVLGGAFLVRAVTEGGAVRAGAGVATGLVYALVWLAVAERAAHRRQVAEATAYGLCAAVVVYPLVWEAAGRFGVLAPAGAALLLAALTGAFLAVSARHGLQALAWSAILGGVFVCLGLSIATHAILPFTGTLLALLAVSLPLAASRSWTGFAWLPGLAVSLVLATAAMLVSRPEGPPESFASLSASAVRALALVLAAVHAGSLIGRGAWRHPIGAAAAAHGGLALVVAFAAASAVSPRGTARVAVAVVTIGVALLTALLALGLARDRSSRSAAVVFAGTGVALTAIAIAWAMPAAAAAPALAGLGLASAMACRFHARGAAFVRGILGLYGAACVIASWWTGGLLWRSANVLIGGADAGRLTNVDLATLALCVAAATVLIVPTREPRSAAAEVSALAVLVVAAAMTCAAAMALLAYGGAAVGMRADAAALALLRTIVLAAATLALAVLARATRWSAAAALVYACLAVGGVKLLLQDLPQGRPATLFIAFAVYGLALIVAPRWSRGTKASAG